MLLNSSRVLTILASSCVLLLTPTQCSLVAASPAPPPPLPEGTALNINLAQPLFDGFKPIFNSLLVRNLNKLAIPDLDVALPAVPGVIDVIDFHVRNLKTGKKKCGY